MRQDSLPRLDALVLLSLLFLSRVHGELPRGIFVREPRAIIQCKSSQIDHLLPMRLQNNGNLKNCNFFLVSKQFYIVSVMLHYRHSCSKNFVVFHKHVAIPSLPKCQNFLFYLNFFSRPKQDTTFFSTQKLNIPRR